MSTPPTGASRSARPGTPSACSAARSTPSANCCCSAHAFEKLDCIAVEFRTHFFNQQSRRGIERLGAKQDGILRNHQIAPNGTLRDTVVYSIIASEWPTAKAHLDLSTQRKGAVAVCPRQKRQDGNVRLRDHRRGLRRQRARQPAERRRRHQHLRARGRAQRLASLHPSAGRFHQDLPHEEHQLGLPAGAGAVDRRAAASTRRAARRSAARPRSTATSTTAASARISIPGRSSATAAGAIRTCCPTSSGWSGGSARARTPIAAATAR